MKKNLFLLFAILIQLSYGQNRKCGMDEKMKQIYSNPVEKKKHEEQQQLFLKEYQRLNNLAEDKLKSELNATKRIPVAIHFPEVPNNSSTSLKDCLRKLCQNQINTINVDFNAKNTDLSKWVNNDIKFYKGIVNGSLLVNFEIATQNHPAGSGLKNGDLAITFGTYFDDNGNDTRWAGYLNIVVKELGDDLGFAPLGADPEYGQFTAISSRAFGSGTGCTDYKPEAPFNLGRTLTHELGHYFNLYHIFNNGTCQSSDSDNIADTPKQVEENYGSPDPGSIKSCDPNNPTLSMNYMDYTDDKAMYMFTVGQAKVMLAWLNTISNQFITNTLNNEEFLTNKFSIKPNPSKGQFTIDFNENIEDLNLKIYDVTGKMIADEDINNPTAISYNKTLNEKGIFFLVLQSKEGVITKKLIVE